MEQKLATKIMVSVYRDASGSDCTNGGITSTNTDLMLYSSLAEYEADEHKTDRHPSVYVITRNLFGKPYSHAVPVNQPKGFCGPMAGGNFVYTCDSRYREVTGGVEYPISVHDRFETAELNALLST